MRTGRKLFTGGPRVPLINDETHARKNARRFRPAN